MDIKAEKLYLIEQLTQLQDVKVIQQIKNILNTQKELVAGSRPDGRTITQSALLARAKASTKAIKDGEIIKMDDLEEESKGW